MPCQVVAQAPLVRTKGAKNAVPHTLVARIAMNEKQRWTRVRGALQADVVALNSVCRIVSRSGLSRQWRTEPVSDPGDCLYRGKGRTALLDTTAEPIHDRLQRVVAAPDSILTPNALHQRLAADGLTRRESEAANDLQLRLAQTDLVAFRRKKATPGSRKGPGSGGSAWWLNPSLNGLHGSLQLVRVGRSRQHKICTGSQQGRHRWAARSTLDHQASLAALANEPYEVKDRKTGLNLPDHEEVAALPACIEHELVTVNSHRDMVNT